MKYIIILADGMAGAPLEELGGKTTLEIPQARALLTPSLRARALSVWLRRYLTE